MEELFPIESQQRILMQNVLTVHHSGLEISVLVLFTHGKITGVAVSRFEQRGY